MRKYLRSLHQTTLFIVACGSVVRVDDARAEVKQIAKL